jgi:hypothetical protein
MPLTLQKKLELAGALSKVQPQLQRLHLLPPPKKSHRRRNAILIASAAIVAVVVAAGLLRRRGGSDDGLPEFDWDTQASFLEQDALAGEPDGMAGQA